MSHPEHSIGIAFEPGTPERNSNPTKLRAVASNYVAPDLDIDPDVYPWQDEANCKGQNQDKFFPERGASTRAAKAICAECVVRDECLDYAVEVGEKFGIWGGKSEQERRKIRRERSIANRQLRFK